ncbi:MAG: hypothetical protein HC884_05635 [Chloroflexaceae bacterium]|nr:hypothetical protein [Chloroflexaceae bacterium]
MVGVSIPKRLSAPLARPVFWFLGILVGLLLAGCTVEQNITILPEEQWELGVSVELPPEAVEQMGGVEEIRKQAEESEDSPENFSIEERGDGSVVMTGTSTGQGFENLNNEAFDGSAEITTDADGKVSISWAVENPGMMGMTMIIRVTGAEIIDSNADEVKGSTATWTNPSQVNVTLTPGRGSGGAGGGGGLLGTLLIIVVVLVVLALVAGGVVFFLMSRKSAPAQAPEPTPVRKDEPTDFSTPPTQQTDASGYDYSQEEPPAPPTEKLPSEEPPAGGDEPAGDR